MATVGVARAAIEAVLQACKKRRRVLDIMSCQSSEIKIMVYAMSLSMTLPPNWLSCLKRPAW